MECKAGIWIHPEELTDEWVSWAVDAKLDMLGLHPVGGSEAAVSLQALIDLMRHAGFRARLERLQEQGIQVEYACHALSWLLPRERFAQNPSWFRLDESGSRTADFNCCPSNPEAMEELERRSALLARDLYTGNHRYHFWADDAFTGACHCPECSSYTPSDNLLRMLHVVLNGIRRIDPKGKLAYLAYHDTLNPPVTVRPNEGIYLEYAPMDRDHHRPLADSGCEKNAGQLKPLLGLIRCFGQKDASALDYWMDNSLFSGWKKPPALFNLDMAVLQADAQLYRDYGFEYITSFGCYLGQDYVEHHHLLPPVQAYAQALQAHGLCAGD
jgi:hypothetical protein